MQYPHIPLSNGELEAYCRARSKQQRHKLQPRKMLFPTQLQRVIT